MNSCQSIIFSALPELPPDAAIDDEVDRWIHDEEEVVDAHQHEEGHGDVVQPATPENGSEK